MDHIFLWGSKAELQDGHDLMAISKRAKALSD